MAHQIVNHQSLLVEIVEVLLNHQNHLLVVLQVELLQNLQIALTIVTIVSSVVIWVDGLTVKKK